MDDAAAEFLILGLEHHETLKAVFLKWGTISPGIISRLADSVNRYVLETLDLEGQKSIDDTCVGNFVNLIESSHVLKELCLNETSLTSDGACRLWEARRRAENTPYELTLDYRDKGALEEQVQQEKEYRELFAPIASMLEEVGVLKK